MDHEAGAERTKGEHTAPRRSGSSASDRAPGADPLMGGDGEGDRDGRRRDEHRRELERRTGGRHVRIRRTVEPTAAPSSGEPDEPDERAPAASAATPESDAADAGGNAADGVDPAGDGARTVGADPGDGGDVVTVPTGDTLARVDDGAGRTGRRRISKWDRPSEPHDWRFFVRHAGKALVAVGVLLFGFVGYQLWGTGIETARAQHQLEDRFAATVAAGDVAAGDAGTETADADPEPDATNGTADGEPDAASDPETGTSADATVDTTVDATTAATGDVAGSGDDTASVTDATGTTDTTAAEGTGGPIAAVDLSDVAVAQGIPPITTGDPLAKLEIPRIDSTTYVVPGVRVDDLKKGPGHYPDTPLPGQLGNAAIAGHRTTYGAPFFDIDQLEPGDEVIVTMLTGDRFVYVVTGTDVVGADDTWVVATSDPDIAELTLTSCHPKYTARDRIVVHGLLDPDRSSAVGFPTPYDLDRDGDTTDVTDAVADETDTGDVPVVSAAPATTEAPARDGGIADVTVDDATTAADDVTTDDATTAADDATTDDATTAVADIADGAPGDDGIGSGAGDEFGRGWFHDGEAFPQIALWGLALTAVSLLAYGLSRRLRHDSIGLVVGLAPFVVALYFFFQNVNRLLPPGL